MDTVWNDKLESQLPKNDTPEWSLENKYTINILLSFVYF